MKHLHYEGEVNTEISTNKSNKILAKELENIEKDEGYSQLNKKNIGENRERSKYLNVKINLEETSPNRESLDQYYEKLANFIGSSSKKQKKSKSKVFKIIDHDIDESQNDENYLSVEEVPINQLGILNNKYSDEGENINGKNLKRIEMEKSEFNLMRLPQILNKNNSLSKNETNKQKEFLSFIYSQINSNRNYSNYRKEKSRNQRSNKSIDPHQDHTIDYHEKSFDNKSFKHNKGHFFPTVHSHRTISMSEPEPKSKKTKNQIKLSGFSVVPVERTNFNKEITSLGESKTHRSRNNNLISSEMIHNNQIENVKKSVYQLLVRKAHSSY